MRKVFGLSLFVTAVGLFFVQAVSTNEPQGYRGFVVTSSRYIPESHCTLVELEHLPTGAQVMHIQNDDPENFFALCFRTHPTKSHGVAHIIEHTVLQGSQKFPINNVFFHMNKRSFATFMNALTGPDYTCYPASSQCPDDFYNLLDVYSDAVFHPLLKKSAFAQEGHRLEFEEFDNPSTPLMYKGVVYNEMKGSLTSPQVRMLRASNAALFPDAMGDVYSGGDPACIPELTYDEYLQFHKDHYYPGNCLFYFYGNLPLERHLDFLFEHVLKDEQRRAPVPEKALQPCFTEPRYQEVPYPVSQGEGDKTILGINWMIHPTGCDAIALRVLDFMLMGSDAAPLKYELLQSGLCKEVDSGCDVYKRQIPYLLYIEGLRAEHAKQLQELVLAAFARIAQEGITHEMLERALARLELEESDLRKSKGPVGLSLLHSCAVSKLHGGACDAGLTLQEQLASLKLHLRHNPRYLSEFIQKHFIDNAHRVCVVLTPDLELAGRESKAEAQKLASIKDGLSQQEIASIIAVAKELRDQPESGDLLHCLPTVTLDSVSHDVPSFALEQDSCGALQLFHHPVFTNHITYASLEFSFTQLDEDELWQASLYLHLLPQLGNRIRSYKDNLIYINEHTGGISADFAIHKCPSGSYPVCKISGKALDRKAELLLDLFYDTLTSANVLDRERIRQLVVKHANEVDAALQANALEIATLASLASQSVENRLYNSWGGLEYCIKIKELAQNLDTQLDTLITKLQRLQKKLVPSSKAHLVLACDEDAYKVLEAANFGKLSTLYPEAVDQLWTHTSFGLPKATDSVYHLVSPVAFNARGFCTVNYSHPDSAYLLLAAELVTGKYLHTRIREQGGAYGAQAKYDPQSGNFCFCTYRDPNIASSDQAFKEAIALLAEGNFTEVDLQKAKLGVLQRLDAPLHPALKAFIGYQYLCENRRDVDRKAFRHALLTASVSDVQQASHTHLPGGFAQSALFTLASKDLVEQENKKRAQPLLSIYSCI